MRISRRAWYRMGGLQNRYLYRVMRGRTWHYYSRIANGAT